MGAGQQPVLMLRGWCYSSARLPRQVPTGLKWGSLGMLCCKRRLCFRASLRFTVGWPAERAAAPGEPLRAPCACMCPVADVALDLLGGDLEGSRPGRHIFPLLSHS